MIACDESSRIKNYKSKTYKALNTLKPDMVYTRAMTGTPNPHDVMDFYPQLRFIGELNGVSPVIYRNRYARMGGYMGKQVLGINEYNKEELMGIIDRSAFIAKKSDWTDLPEKVYKMVEGEMTTKQRDAYREMLADAVYYLNENDVITAPMVISQMLKLQQIASGFILDAEGRGHQLMPFKETPKFKMISELISDINSKVIIFTHHRYSTAQMMEAYPDFAYLKSGMSPEQMREQKDRFNNNDKCGGIIAQTAVGARGHTLLGTSSNRCSNAVFFENTYNLEDRIQAEDRNHRHGQDAEIVQIWDTVVSYQEKQVIKALWERKDMMNSILDVLKSTHSS
jgi:SNF2 family DNA or RNA helicase